MPEAEVDGRGLEAANRDRDVADRGIVVTCRDVGEQRLVAEAVDVPRVRFHGHDRYPPARQDPTDQSLDLLAHRRLPLHEHLLGVGGEGHGAGGVVDAEEGAVEGQRHHRTDARAGRSRRRGRGTFASGSGSLERRGGDEGTGALDAGS